MSEFLTQISFKSEELSACLAEMYAKNMKSDNATIQKAIDWAPSIIMAVGVQLAPTLAIGLAASALFVHIKNPKIISGELIKDILTGFALNFAGNSLKPVAKALLYISLVTAVYVTAKYFEELKQIGSFAQKGQFEEVLHFTHNQFEAKKNELLDYAKAFLSAS